MAYYEWVGDHRRFTVSTETGKVVKSSRPDYPVGHYNPNYKKFGSSTNMGSNWRKISSVNLTEIYEL